MNVTLGSDENSDLPSMNTLLVITMSFFSLSQKKKERKNVLVFCVCMLMSVCMCLHVYECRGGKVKLFTLFNDIQYFYQCTCLLTHWGQVYKSDNGVFCAEFSVWSDSMMYIHYLLHMQSHACTLVCVHTHSSVHTSYSHTHTHTHVHALASTWAVGARPPTPTAWQWRWPVRCSDTPKQSWATT